MARPITVAFDIETCPRPVADFTPREKRRYDAEMRRKTMKDIQAPIAEVSSRVRSVHPWLGWICCVSVARRSVITHAPHRARSWTAATMEGEADLLGNFWEDMDREGLLDGLLVSFNGKGFDAPFIQARSLAHGLLLPRAAGRLLSTHRWQNQPHFDLAHAFAHRVGLADVCELLGVEMPKGDLDGSQVAGAVARGEIARVARYCEGDTVATLDCHSVLIQRVPHLA